MNTDELINAWKAEERIAHIHGWDNCPLTMSASIWSSTVMEILSRQTYTGL